MVWTTVKTGDEDKKDDSGLPSERESSSMIYHADTDRLIVFGGRANEWDTDIHALNISSIAGSLKIDQAKHEARMESTLKKLEETYSQVEFETSQHKDTDIYLLKVNGGDLDQLEEDQVSVNAMLSSRFLATFEGKCSHWQKSLAGINEVCEILCKIQSVWIYLENLFSGSDEIKKKVPNGFEKFAEADKEIKDILADGKKMTKLLEFCNQENILTRLEEADRSLNICQKELNDLIDRMRKKFPRFYFVSNDEMLDILSSGSDAKKIMPHISNIFSAIKNLFLEGDGDTLTATGLESCEGQEEIKFDSPLSLTEDVDSYLSDVIEKIKSTLRAICGKSNKDLPNMERKDWLKQDPAQLTLLVS